MTRRIFINLPVADLDASIAFYEQTGFQNEPAFTDATAAMMRLSDTIAVMLLTHARFADFTPRTVADAKAVTQVLLALSVDSRADVDAAIDRAVAAGGQADPGPVQDHGFMYGRSYADPDGHIFELVWMDMAALPSQPDAPLAD
ncbi:VOC family protein [Aureimonas frigidaquae]|uniref:Glyoxalase family protein n=1 Tax=Aureimonas frigidaquae TaxID=424757 RepID=A0A0P0Z0W1_9HYPH|nr:VOC family protein [Aureimonas frigidaquae]BAT27539.1 glyoxalase family protein [Aureimonas frigidaquae]